MMYQLLIEPEPKTRVLSNKFFRHVQSVVQSVLVNLDYGPDRPVALLPTSVTGMMMMNGHNISLIPNPLRRSELSIGGRGARPRHLRQRAL